MRSSLSDISLVTIKSPVRRFEVPTALGASSGRNFKSKSGTGIIDLLVPLCFRSSCPKVLRCFTNFGSGALAPRQRLEELRGEVDGELAKANIDPDKVGQSAAGRRQHQSHVALRGHKPEHERALSAGLGEDR